MDADLLDGLLSLEDDFYNEGYALGTADGARAGHLEGKAFGLEKGFEKFLEMGIIHGKATVWAKRLTQDNSLLPAASSTQTHPLGPTEEGIQCELGLSKSGEALALLEELSNLKIPPLPVNPRLEKHIKALLALSDPATLSTENTEETVAEFDGRLRKAQAKVKVIEKIIGESVSSELSEAGTRDAANPGKVGKVGDGTGNIEDISSLHVRH
jgi:hypothetical protein